MSMINNPYAAPDIQSATHDARRSSLPTWRIVLAYLVLVTVSQILFVPGAALRVLFPSLFTGPMIPLGFIFFDMIMLVAVSWHVGCHMVMRSSVIASVVFNVLAWNCFVYGICQLSSLSPVDKYLIAVVVCLSSVLSAIAARRGNLQSLPQRSVPE